MKTATETQLDTIRARRFDATARTMMVDGVTITHDQCDALPFDAIDWIRSRLGLVITDTDIGVECAPYAPACDQCGHPIAPEGTSIPADDDVDTTGQGRPRCSDTACTC